MSVNLITGATGYMGLRLCEVLKGKGISLKTFNHEQDELR